MASFIRQFQTHSDGLDPDTDKQARALINRLQGNILFGHGRKFSTHLLLKFTGKPLDCRQALRSIAATITTSLKQHKDRMTKRKDENYDGGLFTTVSISARGYEYLGFEIEDFEKSFRRGMKFQSDDNTDRSQDEWEPFYTSDIHAFIMLADDSETTLKQAIQSVKTAASNCATIHEEAGNRLFDKQGEDLEHFGYRDGVSQPLFFKADFEKKGAEVSREPYDPSAPLHLVVTDDPLVEDDLACGSYLVFRKLEQDVPGWNARVVALAQQLGSDPNLVGAQAVGRFRDGTPVSERGSARGGDNADKNDFDYDDDEDGDKCPFHAHIRKSNPRESQWVIPIFNRERSRRIARRAVPYGAEEGQEKRGLLFMCYQNDISHQFEFIQRTWLDNPSFPPTPFDADTGTDPVLGQLDGVDNAQRWPKKWGSDDVETHEFGRFVHLRGGEYFFTPSVDFFQQL